MTPGEFPFRPRTRVDVVIPGVGHEYWSTHCRHNNHDACRATELAPGVPRRPASCKHCGSPCICPNCDHGEQEAAHA